MTLLPSSKPPSEGLKLAYIRGKKYKGLVFYSEIVPSEDGDKRDFLRSTAIHEDWMSMQTIDKMNLEANKPIIWLAAEENRKVKNG